MERNRQVQFPSPFDPDNFDFERELWVPGRKTIFLPTVEPVSMFDLVKRDLQTAMEFWITRAYEQVYAECVPSRSEYLVIPRRDFRVPLKTEPKDVYDPKWGNLKRSTEPQFRSRRFGVMYDRDGW